MSRDTDNIEPTESLKAGQSVGQLRAENRLLREQVAKLCDALLRKDSEQDGNWGHPSFYDEVRAIRAEIKQD